MVIKRLVDKVVVITGAASGIGRATALAFARKGAHIVAADLNAEALEPLCEEIEAPSVCCLPHAVNVANEAGMKAFAENVQACVGAPMYWSIMRVSATSACFCKAIWDTGGCRRRRPGDRPAFCHQPYSAGIPRYGAHDRRG